MRGTCRAASAKPSSQPEHAFILTAGAGLADSGKRAVECFRQKGFQATTVTTRCGPGYRLVAQPGRSAGPEKIGPKDPGKCTLTRFDPSAVSLSDLTLDDECGVRPKPVLR